MNTPRDRALGLIGFQGKTVIVAALLVCVGCGGAKPAQKAPKPPKKHDAVSARARVEAAKVIGAIKWVKMPAGEFVMGSDESASDSEKPAHKVRLKGFEIAATEITVGQYQACVRVGACTPPHWDDGKCRIWKKQSFVEDRLREELRSPTLPIMCVDWKQARAFSSWIMARLPSEAEWEYAARSLGKRALHPWGDGDPTCDRVVMEQKDGVCEGEGPMRPCSKPEGNTAQGLCDMLGNVFEWTEDCHTLDYGGAPTDGKARVHGCSELGQVVRGGAYQTPRKNLTAIFRPGYEPDLAFSTVGFRPARMR